MKGYSILTLASSKSEDRRAKGIEDFHLTVNHKIDFGKMCPKRYLI